MLLELTFAALMVTSSPPTASDMRGAWHHARDDGSVGTWIVSDTHFSIAWYAADPATFISTEGGSWSSTEEGIAVKYEFDTAMPDHVGTTRALAVESHTADTMRVDGRTWTRIDDGSPGALQGAWLMIGRVRDGETQTRVPGARRTMKILSGTRFQWIAYNVETREFFGSGGGSYTTSDGAYVESIEFFSRDASRVGMSLDFRFEIRDGAWNHVGKSSKGDPMHEIWKRRSDLGI